MTLHRYIQSGSTSGGSNPVSAQECNTGSSGYLGYEVTLTPAARLVKGRPRSRRRATWPQCRAIRSLASTIDQTEEFTVKSQSPHDASDYIGPATVVIATDDVEVQVELRGYFQPIDGRFSWYGRIRQNDELDNLLGGRRRSVLVRTSTGEAPATIGDRDFWGRYRVQGRGRPPYHVPTTLEEVEATQS